MPSNPIPLLFSSSNALGGLQLLHGPSGVSVTNKSLPHPAFPTFLSQDIKY